MKSINKTKLLFAIGAIGLSLAPIIYSFAQRPSHDNARGINLKNSSKVMRKHLDDLNKQNIEGKAAAKKALEDSIQQASKSGATDEKAETNLQYEFIAKKFAFKGNAKLDSSIFLPMVEPFIGQKYTVKTEAQILKEISEKYNEKGYIFSYVQSVDKKNGVVTINILEGHIRDIIYHEDFAKDPVFRYCIEKLKSLKPFNQKEADVYFGMLRQVAGMSGEIDLIQKLLLPLKNIDPANPAVVDLVIENNFHAISGMLSLNNRYRTDHSSQIKSSPFDSQLVEYSGSNYAQGLVIANNHLGFGEEISLNYTTSGDREDQTGSVEVAVPMGFTGGRYFTRFMHNDAPVNNEQKMTYFTAGMSYPIYMSYSKAIEANFAIQRYNEVQKQYEDNDKKRTNVTKLISGLALKNKAYNLDLAYHQSVSGVKRHTAKDEFGKSKNFSVLKLAGDYTFPLQNDYDFSVSFDSQYSKNDLLFSEVFSVGVFKGGRGFGSSAIIGDKGFSTALELSKQFLVPEHPFFLSHKEYVYLDNAYVWNNVESKYKAKRGNATSVGIGSDITLRDNLVFNLEYSMPIREKLTGSLVKKSEKAKSKIFAGVDYLFAF